MAAPDWLIRPVAHRGLHDAARGIVENTPSAVGAAIDAGYAVEVDLREAKDGEAMVFHDATLERLTEAVGPLRALSSDALRRVAFRGTRDRMQTLDDLLRQVAGRVPLLLEVKSDWDARGPFERRIARTLDGYGGPVAAMSFDPASVAVFRDVRPGLVRGLVAQPYRRADAAGLPLRRRLSLLGLLAAFMVRPHFIAYDVRALPAAAPLIARRLFGRPLLAWTVRTEAQRRVADRWADAMIFESLRP